MVPTQVLSSVLAFMLIYGAVMVGATMLLLFSGLDVVTAFTAVIACINNTGPGLGQVGPAGNYQGLTDFQTWVCTITMLLGRLELLLAAGAVHPRLLARLTTAFAAARTAAAAIIRPVARRNGGDGTAAALKPFDHPQGLPTMSSGHFHVHGPHEHEVEHPAQHGTPSPVASRS